MKRAAGITSIAIAYPPTVRGNDHWLRNHPELVAQRGDQHLARVWSPQEGESKDEEDGPFVQAMRPYLADPFRGAVERRVLDPGATAHSLELPAAQRALAARGLQPSDLGLIICSSFLPDALGIGNAAQLAKALGVACSAWNLESACSSSLVALEQAASLVETGRYQHVLVVISCTYSRVNPDTDTLSFSVGDGAAAFVVSQVPSGFGVLGMKTLNTADKLGAMFYELDEQGLQIRMRAGRSAGRALAKTSEDMARACCLGALEQAAVTLADIDFFVLPTPVAWYAEFCAKLLGFPMTKTLNMHATYANTGPVLMPTNLYHAAKSNLVREGSLVLLHTVGIVANASAAVVRWGDVAVG